MDESEAHFHSTKLTREHVLGQQFVSLVEGSGPYSYDRIRFDGDEEGADSYKSWTSQTPVDWVTRAFCRRCNSGWMARIDNRARPVVEKLMTGGPPFKITDDERSELAIWAYKASLGFDFVTATSVRHDPAVRSEFFNSRLVPTHATVVAGTVAFHYANALHALRTGRLPLTGLGPYRIFSLLLRNIVIQVVSSCNGHVAVPPLDLVPLRGPARAILHPTEDIAMWPPAAVIQEAADLRAVVSGIAPFPTGALAPDGL